MNKKHIFLLISFSLVIKVLYLIFNYTTTDSKANLYNQYISIGKKNDTYWYEKISKKGYPELRKREEIGFSKAEKYKQSEWAFFPFYPALNKYTSNLLGIHFNTSALIWSTLFSTLAIIGTYWFGVTYFEKNNIAFYNTILIFTFPFSFYYSVFYTEAVFLSFMIFSFIAIHYRKYWLLGLLLIPLTLLRPNGIIILLPLYLYHLEQNELLKKFTFNWKNIFKLNNIKQSLFFLTSPVAFLAYCLYQFEKTGFYFAFSIAQEGWYREFMFPILSFFRRGDFATQFNSIYTILIIIFAIWFRKKIKFSLNSLIFISLLLPLCSGSVTSMPRFISVIFPLFMILSQIIFISKYNNYFLFICVILHFVTFYTWITNQAISL